MYEKGLFSSSECLPIREDMCCVINERIPLCLKLAIRMSERILVNFKFGVMDGSE